MAWAPCPDVATTWGNRANGGFIQSGLAEPCLREGIGARIPVLFEMAVVPIGESVPVGAVVLRDAERLECSQ